MSLPYQRALVTGASSGIGAAIARRLAREGVPQIRLLARRQDRLDALAAEIPGAEPIAADLCEPAGMERAIQSLEGVDLLVNNAGAGLYGPFASASPDRLADLVTLNCLAPVRLTRAALPAMVAKGHGAVVNIASGMAFQPSPYLATYAATKAFVLYWSEGLYEELRGQGVNVLAVSPGVTPTEFGEVAQVPSERLWVMKLVTSSIDQVVDDVILSLRRGRASTVSGPLHSLFVGLGALSPRWVKRSLFAAFLKP